LSTYQLKIIETGAEIDDPAGVAFLIMKKKSCVIVVWELLQYYMVIIPYEYLED